VIEIREGANEQVIQAQLRTMHGTTSQPSSSQGSSSGGVHSSIMPGIVACTTCNSRFAEGVKFCGRCGGRSFVMVSPGEVTNTFPCPRCTTPLPQNSKFCGRCGLSMPASFVQPQSQPVGFSSGINRSIPPQAERVCRKCGVPTRLTLSFAAAAGTRWYSMPEHFASEFVITVSKSKCL
jgi:hypothetical protein